MNVLLSAKVNMGDYESAQVSVGLTLPCEPNEIDAGQVYEDCLIFCKSRMMDEVNKLKDERGF